MCDFYQTYTDGTSHPATVPLLDGNVTNYFLSPSCSLKNDPWKKSEAFTKYDIGSEVIECVPIGDNLPAGFRGGIRSVAEGS